MISEESVEARIEQRRRARPRLKDERVTMAHGAGGKASRALVEGLIVPAFDNPVLDRLGDAATLPRPSGPIAMTTDSFVVRPIRFPGGSIGSLSVHGTVNDLAVSGARPYALSVGLILEEGLETSVLRAEIDAIAKAAGAAGVLLACGDTKVVERGKADLMYINTAGIGIIDDRARLDTRSVQVGDRVIVSGPIGDHGITILIARGDLDLEADVISDTADLWPVVDALLDACGPDVRCMRDATRGGVATVLNEIALAAEIGIVLDEAAVPVRPVVYGACELLGLDPLYVANEGRLVAFVAPDAADRALAAIRGTPLGSEAAIVGEVTADPPGRVLGRTSFGGHRMIDMLVGDPLPRIC
ncbi:MAG: hydrogenase expression/formation protein HypE [Ilumatobacteraceae bacterium]